MGVIQVALDRAHSKRELLLCPACHHPEHDPGACSECPRCELHVDEALEWVARVTRG